MDERYTYGYNNGWNVENEYINKIKLSFEEYENQLSKIKEINSELDLIATDMKRSYNEPTEEQLREWYSEDNIDVPFETYKEQMKQAYADKRGVTFNPEYNDKTGNLSLERDKKWDEYYANLYKLVDEKENLRKNLISEKQELEVQLRRANIELDRINIGDSDKNYDEVFLSTQKLEHALEFIDEKLKELELTEEERELLVRGLNPRQRKIYEDLIREPKKEETLDYTNDYNKKLEEYEMMLDAYNEDLERLDFLSNELNNNRISFEEYENFANYMKERYRFMQTQYNDILKLYEEVKQKNDNRQTWHPNLSKEQIEELNQKGINKPEGQEYEKYLEEHGLTSESIQAPIKPGEIYGLGQTKKERKKIISKEHKANLTWKTAVAVAMGIGAGVAIFTIGPTGVIIANAIAGITKGFVSRQRQKAHAKGFITREDVNDLDEPSSKFKKAIYEVRRYFKSEEGLRDLSWFLTSEIITSSVLTIADKLGLLKGKTQPTPQPKPEPKPKTQPTPQPKPEPDIKVGDTLGKNVPTTGHDTAKWAINEVNPEHLNPKLVDGNSVIKRICGYNSSGQLVQFNSVKEAINAGINPADIVVDIGKNGISQSWNTLADIGYEVANTTGKVI